ncbi:hypothetical protein [Halobacillus salinus]|uniref:hypothetical protein n=1 Tax=Halobacillus salinus TaxID=192814 RepID=UPI0009A61A08|nr:hypothetical protein [Halobacillus salinus]
MKKVALLVFTVMVGLFLAMVATTPSEAAFHEWISEEHNIVCETDGTCWNGDDPIRFQSSHFRNAGLFATLEQTFEQAEGEEVITRTVGIFGQWIEMENNKLWEILN